VKYYHFLLKLIHSKIFGLLSGSFIVAILVFDYQLKNPTFDKITFLLVGMLLGISINTKFWTTKS